MNGLHIDKRQWKKVKLSDVVFEPKETTNNIVDDGFEHIVGLEHLDGEDVHLRRSFSNSEETTFSKVFRENDVLFGRRRAYLKKAVQAKFDGVCSGDITVMRSNGKLDTRLFPFLIQNEKFFDYAVKHSAGGLSPRVKFKDLANYEFLLPPKNQQAELTELLWAMDDVIEKDLKVLETLEKYAKSETKVFFSGIHNCKLDDILELNYGKALKDSERIIGKYPVVSSSGIQGTHNAYLTRGPGIVIGRKGNVGFTTWVQDDFWVIDTAYYVSLKEKLDNYPLKAIYYILKNLNFNINSIATAVPGLNRQDALNMGIFLPDHLGAKELINRSENHENLQSILQSKLSASKALQKALINQLF